MITAWLRLAWACRPTRAHLRYAYLDARARLGGWCNHCPWRTLRASGGGYAHWRCDQRRGHFGAHRYNSYTWGDDNRVHYDPLPDPRPPRARSPWPRDILGTTWPQMIRQAWTFRAAQVAKLRRL